MGLDMDLTASRILLKSSDRYCRIQELVGEFGIHNPVDVLAVADLAVLPCHPLPYPYAGIVDTSALSRKEELGTEELGTVEVRAMYWRNRRDIHWWFIHNVQAGVDDCGKYPVSVGTLETLVSRCTRALELSKKGRLNQAEKAFYTGTPSFYRFGWWDEDSDKAMQRTINGISYALNFESTSPLGMQFTYSSSW